MSPNALIRKENGSKCAADSRIPRVRACWDPFHTIGPTRNDLNIAARSVETVNLRGFDNLKRE